MNLMQASLFTLVGAVGAWTFAATHAAELEPTNAIVAQTSGDSKDGKDAMAEMMKKAARYTQPGEEHKALERLIGKWDTDAQFCMGSQTSAAGRGSLEFSWLMPGRWIQARGAGTFMGMPADQFHVIGYDRFKMSYVSTHVTNLDTAMIRLEGDMTPDGKALLMYGTLDEYLTGENDKMIKYVWRFVSADKIVLEVHDLPIGEVGTKVVEVTMTRAK